MNDSKGEQSLDRLYEKLPNGMQIVEVRSNSISLREESGTRFDMYVNHDMKTVGVSSQSAHISPSTPGPATSDAEPLKPSPRRGKQRRTSSTEED